MRRKFLELLSERTLSQVHNQSRRVPENSLLFLQLLAVCSGLITQVQCFLSWKWKGTQNLISLSVKGKEVWNRNIRNDT
jgi:hypothetical protein